ncbi:MAG: electron transporter, partial [Planctomycetes bacterium]|nr:electron transporter [Planctomycetota bacterium]
MIVPREIYWDTPKILVALHYGLFAVGTVIFLSGIFKHIRLWRLGIKENRFSNLMTRIVKVITYALFQFRIIKRPYQGLMHSGIFYGFGLLYIGTLLVLVQADFHLPILFGPFYLYFSLVLDLSGAALLFGLAMALFRR